MPGATLGLGGGGAMYSPAVSPHDPQLMFVACDMGGLYRSTDGGQHWRMVDGRQMLGLPTRPIAFDWRDSDIVYAYGAGVRGLRRSTDRGRSWPESSSLPPTSTSVTAIGPALHTSQRLFVGTESGAYFSDYDPQPPPGSPHWTQWSSCALVGGGSITGRVVDFVFVLDPTSPVLDPAAPNAKFIYFVATTDSVFRSYDKGAQWEKAGAVGPDVRSFAGGANPTEGVMLYVTDPNGVSSSSTDGSTWQSAIGNSPDPGATYEHLSLSRDRPEVVFVTVRGSGWQPPVHSGVLRSLDKGSNWEHIYYGDQNWPQCNVEGGWLDLDVGWGFGGSALGFTVSQSDPDIAMFSNMGALYVTADATTHVGGTPPSWWAAYTEPTTTRGKGQPWRSVGCEVTTTWHYYVDPHTLGDPLSNQRHYICYTDIGFARSLDGGETWAYSAPKSAWNPGPYNTVYELALDQKVKGRMWAAASNQHDIPWETELWEPKYAGGVAYSEDGGKTWSHRHGTGNQKLPTQMLPPAKGRQPAQVVPPVVSIVDVPGYENPYDPDPYNSRVLWVSVFGEGVFRSTDAGKSWVRKSSGLGWPASQGQDYNMNVYRLHRHKNTGWLYCVVTGRRDPQKKTPQNPQGFVRRSGLFLSFDNGDSWTNITADLDPWWVTDFAVHPTDPNIIYLCTAGVQNQQDGVVYKTTNRGGQNGDDWQPILDFDLLPPASKTYRDFFHPFAPFLVSNTPEVVCVTSRSHGILRGEQSGGSWSWHEAFADIPAMSTHRVVFGAWRIPQQGPIWRKLLYEESTVYVTTFGGGVWKATQERRVGWRQPVFVAVKKLVSILVSSLKLIRRPRPGPPPVEGSR